MTHKTQTARSINVTGNDEIGPQRAVKTGEKFLYWMLPLIRQCQGRDIQSKELFYKNVAGIRHILAGDVALSLAWNGKWPWGRRDHHEYAGKCRSTCSSDTVLVGQHLQTHCHCVFFTSKSGYELNHISFSMSAIKSTYQFRQYVDRMVKKKIASLHFFLFNETVLFGIKSVTNTN